MKNSKVGVSEWGGKMGRRKGQRDMSHYSSKNRSENVYIESEDFRTRSLIPPDSSPLTLSVFNVSKTVTVVSETSSLTLPRVGRGRGRTQKNPHFLGQRF